MPRIPKTIPNPEYLKQKLQKEADLFGYPPEDVTPADFGKALPTDGDWIIILCEVKVGREISPTEVVQITVPHLSIWYAVPQITRQGLSQAIIQTPQSAVHIWPHEYNICHDLGRLLECEGDDLKINFLGSQGGFDEEALFYLRSPGISKAAAERMLLPAVKDPYYCYFTFSEDVCDYFPEGTGMMLLNHINHKRRAKTHAHIEEASTKKES